MKWCIPNEGLVVLILGNEKDMSTDKLNMLHALNTARIAGPLPGDLDRFRAILASHIELEAALAEQRLREAA